MIMIQTKTASEDAAGLGWVAGDAAEGTFPALSWEAWPEVVWRQCGGSSESGVRRWAVSLREAGGGNQAGAPSAQASLSSRSCSASCGLLLGSSQQGREPQRAL